MRMQIQNFDDRIQLSIGQEECLIIWILVYYGGRGSDNNCISPELEILN